MATRTVAGAKPRRVAARDKLPSSPDPVDIAMLTAVSGTPLPDAARSVLEKHAKLIDRQAELAQAQCAELRLRRVGEGVRAALWAILAIAALAILAVVGAVIFRAARSDALVVQSFRVPPAMAQQGLTGEVVATQVLDKLAEMQANSESTRAASSYANNWGDELKIDIPQTGASVDQIWRLLREWLGKETRISGEVIRIGPAFALTARVGSTPGQRFTSDKGDLDALIVQAAELIYRETQPYRYGIYVGRQPDRRAERHALLQQLTGDESERERKWAFNGLSVDYRERGELRQSLAMAERALAIDPQMIPAFGNKASAQLLLGHEQLMVDTILRQYAIPLSDEYDPRIVKANNCSTRSTIGYIRRSAADSLWAVQCYTQVGGAFGGFGSGAAANLALLQHDLPAALAVQFKAGPRITVEEAELFAADTALAAALLDEAPERLSAALDRHVAALAALVRPDAPDAAFYRNAARTDQWPRQAEALARLGRTAEARALIERTPRDSYTAVRVRGLVAQAMNQPAEAQRWFAEAVRQGPRLAPAYVDWGRLLAAHRRWESADKRFARAAELAPDWADPLKYWGDLLGAQGKRAEALAKYDAALELAPKWAELRRARAALAARS